MLLSLRIVGTVVTLKILDTSPELHGRILGQIMRQSLPVQSQPETVFPHQCPVVVDGFQMAPEIQGCHLSFYIAIQYTTVSEKRREKLCMEIRHGQKLPERWLDGGRGV